LKFNSYRVLRVNEATINDSLETMWTRAVMARFEILYWRLCGGTEEEYENPVSIFFGPTEITFVHPIEHKSEILMLEKI
jgi:hypothetical protein